MVRPPSASTAGPITDEAIAEAALAILHEGGPAALSFRRVATLLGTSHMTVHRRCHNLDGLLDLCAEHLAATLPGDRPGLPWARGDRAARFTVALRRPERELRPRRTSAGPSLARPEMMRRFSEPALAYSLAAGLP